MTDSKADKSTIIQNLHFHISSAADIHAALNSIAKARDIDLKGVSISIDDSVQTSTKAAQDPVPLTSSSSSSSKKKSKRWLKMKEWFKHRDAQMKQSSGGKSNNKVTKSSSSLGAMVFGIRRAHWDRFEKALEMFPGESMCIITNLPHDITEKDIKEFLRNISSPVVHVSIEREPGSAESRGVALITFKEERHAEAAVKELHGLYVGSNRIKVVAMPKEMMDRGGMEKEGGKGVEKEMVVESSEPPPPLSPPPETMSPLETIQPEIAMLLGTGANEAMLQATLPGPSVGGGQTQGSDISQTSAISLEDEEDKTSVAMDAAEEDLIIL